MATANTIIGRALRLLKVVAAGETIEAGIAADSLAVLNSMGQRMLADGLLAAWTDAATVASTLDPPAAQSEALAANLAVLLAPEFEMEPPQSVVAMASQGRKDLWRDRIVATSPTSRTAGALALRALRIIAAPNGLPDAVSLPGTLVALNAIGNRWAASGLIASWTDVDDVADAVTTDAKADEALVGTLAARLAREYGVQGIEAPALDDLWRDRLAPTGVTRTAGDLIRRALRLVGGGKLPDNVNLQGAVVALNALGERFKASGLLTDWATVAVISDDVSTTAKQDEAIVSNLAMRLAPEYGVAIADTVAAAAAQGMEDLWRDRLIDSSTTGTAKGVILRALRLLSSPAHLHDSATFADSLVTLNAMLAEWHEAGIGLPDYTFASLAAPLDSDAADRDAIAYQLAMRLAPEYGVNLSAEAVAAAGEAMSRLRLRYFQPGRVDPALPSSRSDFYDIEAG